MLAELHFTKDALSLHSLFKNSKCLIDIVVADKNLHRTLLSGSVYGRSCF